MKTFFFHLDADYILSFGYSRKFFLLLEKRIGDQDRWKTIFCFPKDLNKGITDD